MTLMRAHVKVDEDGKVKIPANIARETDLKPGITAEIKVAGTAGAQFVTIRKRNKGQLR